MKKTLLCKIFTPLFAASSLFSVESIPTADLLMSYLQNDNDLKKYAIEAEKAQLSLDSAEISNGFDITLSTGNITVRSENNGLTYSVKPSVKASLPQLSNLSLSATTSYSYKNSKSSLEDAKISASIDVISTNGLSRKISLLKANRSLTEAKRKLKNQALATEKNFYSELKELLNATSSLINTQKDLYSNKIDFEKIKAQGYSAESSTYRLAQMKVISTEHEIENSTRSLINDYVIFYKKCGYNIKVDPNTDFFTLIPADIAQVAAIDVHSFAENTYADIESALWTNEINTMERKLYSNFSLAVNSGVTMNNSTTSSHTVDAGVTSAIGGINLEAGISVPLKENCTPAVTLSASFSPNTFRKNKITEKTNSLAERQELLAIETARTNYANKVTECEQNLENLLWNKDSIQESYEMYAGLEKDLKKWYDQGYITQSEYYSAKVNAQSYYVKKIINAIDFIIYNDNVTTMFVNDLE